ncbi:MAG: BrnT family toxin [Steroidobacteraceae bacterium]
MINLEFEWDDEKAEANWLDHGIAFQEAIKAFRDPFAVERFDDREDYGEERINLVGMCDGQLVHVTYTERGDRLRIISARRAEWYEQDDYYRENST